MRYLLKQISWRRHDRVSELCVRKLICSESHSIWLCWCKVCHAFLASPSVTVTRVEHSHTYNLQLNYAHRPSCQPSFRASSLKPPPILQHVALSSTWGPSLSPPLGKKHDELDSVER